MATVLRIPVLTCFFRGWKLQPHTTNAHKSTSGFSAAAKDDGQQAFVGWRILSLDAKKEDQGQNGKKKLLQQEGFSYFEFSK